MKHLVVSVLALILFPCLGKAGFIELSLLGNYKKNKVDANSFEESRFGTASIAYYFWMMSAIELSYTRGDRKSVVTPTEPGFDTVTTTYDIMVIGADLVIAFAGRDSVIQPFIKGGAAYFEQRVTQKIGDNPSTSVKQDPITVPSAGAGFKIRITQTFSFKGSYETWGKKIDDNNAARAGISWVF